MKLVRNLIVASVLLLGTYGVNLPAQQPKPSPEPPKFPALPASARIWRSLTTGKEYAAWIEDDRLYAEWVNVPANMASSGSSIRIECRRANGRWLGTAQNHLPCETRENGKVVRNFCRVTSKIEFNPLEASRMTGRTEAAHRFDCANCVLLESRWINFEWVPKEPEAVGRKQRPGNR